MKKEVKFSLIIVVLVVIGFSILLIPPYLKLWYIHLEIDHKISIGQILGMYINIVLAVFILRALSRFEDQESSKKKIALEVLKDYIDIIQTDINAILYKKKRELEFIIPLFKKYNSRLEVISNLLRAIKKDNKKISKTVDEVKNQMLELKMSLTNKPVYKGIYIYNQADESNIDQTYVKLLKLLHELTVLIINS